MRHAPLQLYCSALIFCPVPNIRSRFKHLIPSWITHKISSEDAWLPEYSILQGRSLFNHMDNAILTGSGDGTIRLWDCHTGEQSLEFNKFEQKQLLKFHDQISVRCAAISPDGKRIAYACHDGLVRVWEIGQSAAIILEGHKHDVCCVAFIPGSNNMVSSISDEQEFRIWDVHEKNPVHVFQLPHYDDYSLLSYYKSLAILPDGKRVARQSPSPEDSLIDFPGDRCLEVWDTETQKIVTKFAGHSQAINSLAFSMDGSTLVSGSPYGPVILWDVVTGRQLQKLSGYTKVHAVTLSQPDAKLVAVGHGQNAVEVYSSCGIKAWKRLRSFSINGWTLGDQLHNTIESLSFSHDGKKLAIACTDDTTRLCTIAGIDEEPRDARDTRPLNFARFLPGNDGALLARSAKEAKVWDANSALDRPIPEPVRNIKFSPDKRIMALEVNSQAVQLWDNAMETQLVGFDNAEKITFSPDSTHIALYSNKQSRVIEMDTWKEIATLDTGSQIEFSPGNRIVGWPDRFRREYILWDLKARREISALPTLSTPVFSPNGELLAFKTNSALWEEEGYHVILQEVATGMRRASIKKDFCLPSVVFHPNGHLVVIGEHTNDRITAYETDSGRVNSVFKVRDYYDSSGIDALAISPNGNILAAAVSTTRTVPAYHSVHFWDMNTATKIGSLEQTGIKIDPGRLFSFSNDGRHLESLLGRIPLAPQLSDQRDEEDCLYVGKSWIVQGYDNLLWLPKDVFSCSDVRGETVALGHHSSKFTFLKFDLAKTPLTSR